MSNNDFICIKSDDERFSERLRRCNDAPKQLYVSGECDLNAKHIISVVGTRHCTDYGKQITRNIIMDLGKALPGTVIISGLAYGIDIVAHRAALEAGLPTVAVMATGYDQIYPVFHRPEAQRIVKSGGALVTEYDSNARVGKHNFVARNRIVAGMADAVLVVESKRKGGSLITARIAGSYHRDVFAIPGRVGMTTSEGCNALIKYRRASMVENAEDIMREMNWEPTNVPQQAELFPTEVGVNASPQWQAVETLLRGSEEALTTEQIASQLNIKISDAVDIIFDMELKGFVVITHGDHYRWQ